MKANWQSPKARQHDRGKDEQAKAVRQMLNSSRVKLTRREYRVNPVTGRTCEVR